MYYIRAPLLYVATMKKSSNPSVSGGRALQLSFPRHSWWRVLYSFVLAIRGSGIFLCV